MATIGELKEIRESLRLIQKELRAYFPPEAHEVRELKGGGDWIFLRWQCYRERLDEVAPDWQITYSDPIYIGNDAICRCAIEILGVRKEAIATVPISILNTKGKETARGSAPDRLASEGLKNAAEQWGVGAYLDNQLEVAQYLWNHKTQINSELEARVRGILMKLKSSQPFPSKAPVKQPVTPAPQSRIDTPQIDRNMVNLEIESLMKRRNLSTEQAQAILIDNFKVKGRSQLSDQQLMQFKEVLASVN